MTDKTFEQLVEEALDSLPPEFAKKLNNVSVVTAGTPTRAQLKSVNLPPWEFLFGLYQGIPQTKRGIYYSSIPDKITIFKSSILRVSRTPEEIRAQVRATVIHEIGHHFGLSDKQMK